MNQKLNIRKKRVAMLAALLIFASLFFVNVNVFSALKNVGALDTGTVVCAGGGNLDCNGFAAQVILWAP
jgi:hypothetical protein